MHIIILKNVLSSGICIGRIEVLKTHEPLCAYPPQISSCEIRKMDLFLGREAAFGGRRMNAIVQNTSMFFELCIFGCKPTNSENQ